MLTSDSEYHSRGFAFTVVKHGGIVDLSRRMKSCFFPVFAERKKGIVYQSLPAHISFVDPCLFLDSFISSFLSSICGFTQACPGMGFHLAYPCILKQIVEFRGRIKILREVFSEI